jgi:Zn-dependent protease/CBS domain-containing protein
MRSLRIGRIGEIEIKLHPTFVLVLLWVVFDWERAWGRTSSPVWFGLIFVGLIFGCVLLHELGHAFMASQYGLRVHDVTLSVIGGMARYDHAPLTPRGEAAIALAGPAVTMAVVVTLFPLMLLFGAFARFTPIDYLLAMIQPTPVGLLAGLIAANVMLLIFNLLPAFPMDGGRVLRAGLATLIGRERATVIAVRGGQALAAVLGIYAVLQFHSLSLALIAGFIILAAEAEGRAVRIESALRRMHVGQFALWDTGGVAPSQPLAHALQGGARDMVVTEGGQVLGMLWRNQLLNELSSGSTSRTVGDVMERGVEAVSPDESIFDVHQRMERERRPALAVAENGVYRGIFTADRLAHVYRQVAPPPLPGLGPNASLGQFVSGVLRLRPR